MPYEILFITEPLTCPRCGAAHFKNPEAPFLDRLINIRANKVGDENGVWWSQCLICADGHGDRGWFPSSFPRQRRARRPRQRRAPVPQLSLFETDRRS
jgi:hypothetical protein